MIFNDDLKKMNEMLLNNIDSVLNYDKLKCVRDLSEKKLQLKDQRKFHFFPSFLLKEFYEESLYKLNLYSHEISKTNQNDFLVYSDDWKNKYFQIIESCIDIAKYENILKEIIKMDLAPAQFNVFSNSKPFKEALAFLVMRSGQFSNEDLLFGNFINDELVKSNKFKDNNSMQIEFILKSLMWFNRKNDLNDFIIELKKMISENDDLGSDFDFVIHNCIEDNWKDKYLIFQNLINEKEFIICKSKPNSKLAFPLLDQPIGKWTIRSASKDNLLLFRETDVFYIQKSNNEFIFLFDKNDLHMIEIAYENFRAEKNAPKIINQVAKIASYMRMQLYFEDESLQYLYSNSENNLKKWLDDVKIDKKMPIGNFVFKNDNVKLNKDNINIKII